MRERTETRRSIRTSSRMMQLNPVSVRRKRAREVEWPTVPEMVSEFRSGFKTAVVYFWIAPTALLGADLSLSDRFWCCERVLISVKSRVMQRYHAVVEVCIWLYARHWKTEGRVFCTFGIEKETRLIWIGRRLKRKTGSRKWTLEKEGSSSLGVVVERGKFNIYCQSEKNVQNGWKNFLLLFVNID